MNRLAGRWGASSKREQTKTCRRFPSNWSLPFISLHLKVCMAWRKGQTYLGCTPRQAFVLRHDFTESYEFAWKYWSIGIAIERPLGFHMQRLKLHHVRLHGSSFVVVMMSGQPCSWKKLVGWSRLGWWFWCPRLGSNRITLVPLARL